MKTSRRREINRRRRERSMISNGGMDDTTSTCNRSIDSRRNAHQLILDTDKCNRVAAFDSSNIANDPRTEKDQHQS